MNITRFSAGASVGAMGAMIDIATLVFEIATNPTFKARVQEALRGRLGTLANDFRMSMADARNLLVGPHRVLLALPRFGIAVICALEWRMRRPS